MSGAAVWHDDAIVGLVSAHHRTDGLGRLAAVRVDRWYELLTRSELALLHECAGLPASAPELPRIPSAPTAASGQVTLADLRDDLPLRELDGLVGALTALPTVSGPHHPGPGPGQHQPGRQRPMSPRSTGTGAGRLRNPADLPALPGDLGPTPRSDTVDGGRLRPGWPA